MSDDNKEGAGVPVNEHSFVQPVPDHCDRITWRGHYYHLREATPPAVMPAAPSDAADARRYRWLIGRFGVTRLPCMLEPITGDYVADGKEAIDAAIDSELSQTMQPQAEPNDAQRAINEIAALAPLLEDGPLGGLYRCQQCGYAWGAARGAEGHAMNCAYVIATKVPHTEPAAGEQAGAVAARKGVLMKIEERAALDRQSVEMIESWASLQPKKSPLERWATSLPDGSKPVMFVKAEHLKELAHCAGMSVWAESFAYHEESWTDATGGSSFAGLVPLFLAAPGAAIAAREQEGGRTPQDYAIEHAEYMATTAEGLIEAVNDLAQAEQERDEGSANPSDVDAAQETVSEYLGTLRNRIYEFRKRRDRSRDLTALASRQEAPATPQAEPKLTGLHLAVIGRRHFGNPIPAEWYSAARELETALTQPTTVQQAEGLTPDDLFGVIRGTGYVTRGQAQEITELVLSALNGMQPGERKEGV